jgi:hypothetical protein
LYEGRLVCAHQLHHSRAKPPRKNLSKKPGETVDEANRAEILQVGGAFFLGQQGDQSLVEGRETLIMAQPDGTHRREYVILHHRPTTTIKLPRGTIGTGRLVRRHSPDGVPHLLFRERSLQVSEINWLEAKGPEGDIRLPRLRGAQEIKVEGSGQIHLPAQIRGSAISRRKGANEASPAPGRRQDAIELCRRITISDPRNSRPLPSDGSLQRRKAKELQLEGAPQPNLLIGERSGLLGQVKAQNHLIGHEN